MSFRAVEIGAAGIRSLAFSGAFLLTAGSSLAAQQLEPRSFPQQRVESYTFKSAMMGRAYDISVGLPRDYAAQPNKKYPALLVTDGDNHFPAAFSLASGLAGSIEPPIIISIDSPIELSASVNTRRRVHEFSTEWPMNDEFGHRVQELCARLTIDPPQKECIGGAPRFLDFIVAELLPILTSRFRIDSQHLGLFGHSAGGYFVSWAVFQPKSPFTTYIIGSPAMAYGAGEVLRQEARYAESHKDLKIGLYLGSGSLEMSDPRLEGSGQIVSGQIHLAGVLAGRN
jgi:predicted alpha/beta superfamily hydrolase